MIATLTFNVGDHNGAVSGNFDYDPAAQNATFQAMNTNLNHQELIALRNAWTINHDIAVAVTKTVGNTTKIFNCGIVAINVNAYLVLLNVINIF